MNNIDFVIPWVDPTDPKWLSEFNKSRNHGNIKK
ncbi:Stealth CR1 domain-containing protein [Morganella psychrotolerans]